MTDDPEAAVQSPELAQAVERVATERRRYACTMHDCDALAHSMPTLAFDAALTAALRLAAAEASWAERPTQCEMDFRIDDCQCWAHVRRSVLAAKLAAARAACEAL